MLIVLLNGIYQDLRNMTLEELNNKHKKFTDHAFPDITDYKATLQHLRREVDEALASGALEEFADIFLLLLSSYRLRFPERSISTLIDAANIKLQHNKNRKWVMNKQGFAEHDRTVDTDLSLEEVISLGFEKIEGTYRLQVSKKLELVYLSQESKLKLQTTEGEFSEDFIYSTLVDIKNFIDSLKETRNK